MNLTHVTRLSIEDRALRIKELAKHGAFIEGIACSMFNSIYEDAEAILDELATNEPMDEQT